MANCKWQMAKIKNVGVERKSVKALREGRRKSRLLRREGKIVVRFWGGRALLYERYD